MKTNQQQLNTVLTTMTMLVLLSVGPTQSAWATVTYTYVGNPFSYVGTSNYWGAPVTNVSGYFTVASFLPANTDLTLTPDTIGGTITDYSFTDGRYTVDIANYATSNGFVDGTGWTASRCAVTTGANGDITSWFIAFMSPYAFINTFNSPYYDSLYGVSVSDGVAADPSQAYNAVNWNSPGTWTVSGIPEPATICLLGFGGLMLRKRS